MAAENKWEIILEDRIKRREVAWRSDHRARLGS